MKIKDIYPHAVFDHEIFDIVHHSKEVFENCVFVAIPGSRHDGHDYIFEAIAKGAKTVIHEKDWLFSIPQNINFVKVENAKKELARLLKILYGDLWKDLIVIGITGTNGKTTVSSLIYHYLSFMNLPTLLIGNNGSKFGDLYWPLVNTTPDLVTIYRLVKLCRPNLKYVILEVSSQAIRELRILGIAFDVAAITNISQDHFDYHPSWDDYLFSKGLLLTRLKPGGIAVLNREMPNFPLFESLTVNSVISFGKNNGDIKYQVISSSLKGLELALTSEGQTIMLKSPLPGEFNGENLACFYAIGLALGVNFSEIASFTDEFGPVKGRMEKFFVRKRLIVIDYAHTPEAVRQVAEFLRTETLQKLYIVIGCGGERDRLKRPLMLKWALENASWVYVTEDNSRNEPFSQIAADMTKNQSLANYTVIPKRSKAIQTAFANSTAGDIIAILGMGNDCYQEEGQILTDETVVKRMGEKNGFDG